MKIFTGFNASGFWKRVNDTKKKANFFQILKSNQNLTPPEFLNIIFRQSLTHTHTQKKKKINDDDDDDRQRG